MIYICCVCFASLDVVCNELKDCAWNIGVVVVIYPLPLPLFVGGGGESDHPDFGPPARLTLHLASSSITSAGHRCMCVVLWECLLCSGHC